MFLWNSSIGYVLILVIVCVLLFFLRLLFIWIVMNNPQTYPVLHLEDPVTNNNEQTRGIPAQRSRPSQRALRIQRMRNNPIIVHSQS